MFSSRNTQKKKLKWAPNGSRTHDLSEYRLSALTTELWETRTLTLAVWQDTCHTYKNLVYDLAHNESPIAQWLERSTGIWKVMGSTPVEGSENSFSEYFNLRTLLHYLHFIQVTNPFISLLLLLTILSSVLEQLCSGLTLFKSSFPSVAFCTI